MIRKEGCMAKTRKRRGRSATTGRRPKASVKVVHRQKNQKTLHVIVPPGGSTGLHPEKRDYIVVPLSTGPVTIEIHKKVGGKITKTTKVVQYKRGKPFRRKVGSGIQINVTNKSGKHHRWLKDFD